VEVVCEKARVGAKPETLVKKRNVRINEKFMVAFLWKKGVHNRVKKDTYRICTNRKLQGCRER
jgi:hypothetical protein